jgi:hypothetical protein
MACFPLIFLLSDKKRYRKGIDRYFSYLERTIWPDRYSFSFRMMGIFFWNKIQMWSKMKKCFGKQNKLVGSKVDQKNKSVQEEKY